MEFGPGYWIRALKRRGFGHEAAAELVGECACRAERVRQRGGTVDDRIAWGIVRSVAVDEFRRRARASATVPLEGWVVETVAAPPHADGAGIDGHEWYWRLTNTERTVAIELSQGTSRREIRQTHGLSAKRLAAALETIRVEMRSAGLKPGA